MNLSIHCKSKRKNVEKKIFPLSKLHRYGKQPRNYRPERRSKTMKTVLSKNHPLHMISN